MTENENQDPNAQPTTPLPPVNSTPEEPVAPQASEPAAPQAPQPAAPQAPQPAAPQGFEPAAAAPAPPAAPQAPAYAQQPAPQQTNPLAIVALVGSFFIGLVGIICGHIALGQIKKSNGQQGGRGLALAGTIIGYVNTAIWVLVIVFSIVAASIAGAALSAASTEVQQQAEEIQEQLEELPETDPSTEAPAEATGDRSAEFCAAFTRLSEVGSNVSADGKISDEAIQAFKDVAATPSPNQEVYQRSYDVTQDPTLIQKDKSLMEDYIQAAMDDGMACAG